MLVIENTFDPVRLSIPENQFLLKHLGEPWTVAARDIHPVPLVAPHRKDRNPVHYPDGVTPAAVRPVIDRVYELVELEKNHGEKWVGIDAVKAACQTYIAQSEQWEKDKRRGAPRFPSMHSFDSKGRPFKGGPGSDTGQVHSYLTNAGERKPLAIDLIPTDSEKWVAPWAENQTEAVGDLQDGLVVNDEQARIECFCGHVEKFKKDVRSSYNSARARMSKHLRGAKEEVFRHREVHTANFGSPSLEQ